LGNAVRRPSAVADLPRRTSQVSYQVAKPWMEPVKDFEITRQPIPSPGNVLLHRMKVSVYFKFVTKLKEEDLEFDTCIVSADDDAVVAGSHNSWFSKHVDMEKDEQEVEVEEDLRMVKRRESEEDLADRECATINSGDPAVVVMAREVEEEPRERLCLVRLDDIILEGFEEQPLVEGSWYKVRLEIYSSNAPPDELVKFSAQTDAFLFFSSDNWQGYKC
jgi:hypothetical protein